MQFGTNLRPIFGFAKSFKYKTNFKLSLKPKLLVAFDIDWHFGLFVFKSPTRNYFYTLQFIF